MAWVLVLFAAVTDAFRLATDHVQEMTSGWWWGSGSDYLGPRFIEATERSGLADSNSDSSFGSNFVDIDADGDLDLYVTNVGSADRLYLNIDGKGNFSDITESSGLLDPSESRGAAFADVNGDGHLDLYQLNTDIPNRLYLGDGKGHFVRQFDTGLEDDGQGQSVCFGDIDNDGDVDLFFTNLNKSNMLYLNNGRGTFTEATEAAGLTTGTTGTVNCEFGDMDNDGDLDLLLANFVDHNYYYVNDGTGKFVERAEEAGVVGVEGISSGMRLADFNGDGYLDAFCGAPIGGNHLYINDGAGHFIDTTEASGLGNLGHLTSGSAWADVDGDGDLDLLQGHLGFEMKLYENDGNAVFTEVSSEAGIGFHIFTHGIAFGDVDGDGDLDAYINSWDPFFGARQANRFIIQEGEPAYNWLKVRPVNEHGHATLFGAQVRLFEAGTQAAVGVRRHTDGGHCFGSQDAYDVYFGLSQFPESTFDIEVRCGGPWITKATRPELGNVAPNQIVEAMCPMSL